MGKIFLVKHVYGAHNYITITQNLVKLDYHFPYVLQDLYIPQSEIPEWFSHELLPSDLSPKFVRVFSKIGNTFNIYMNYWFC